MSKALSEAKSALRREADPKKATFLQKYFKTGPGEYAEGDRFLGLTVPHVRKLAKRFRELPLVDVDRLIRSRWHEERLMALIILVLRHQRTDEKGREQIFTYLAHLEWVNNWDLVDCSARQLVGAHLHEKDKALLHKLVRSPVVWERRVALIATFYFIGQGSFDEIFQLTRDVMSDEHDLIHKAAGWMLREVGKRSFRASSPSSTKMLADCHGRRSAMPSSVCRSGGVKPISPPNRQENE